MSPSHLNIVLLGDIVFVMLDLLVFEFLVKNLRSSVVMSLILGYG